MCFLVYMSMWGVSTLRFFKLSGNCKKERPCKTFIFLKFNLKAAFSSNLTNKSWNSLLTIPGDCPSHSTYEWTNAGLFWLSVELYAAVTSSI